MQTDIRRKEIHDVFTPRESDVNTSMYVHREEHEKKLNRALKRNSHTLIFGESGNGKSWLYKKVLDDAGIPYVVANCASASRKQSVTQEICDCIIEPGTVEKMGFNEEKAAEIGAYFAKAGLKNTGNYCIVQDDPLLKSFKVFNDRYSGKKIIVLDNLESIFKDGSLVDELCDILILLDDQRFSSCNINILLVGTPNGVIHFLRDAKNPEPVANRLQEMSKVSSLTPGQVTNLVNKGFGQLAVELSLSDLDEISGHIWNVTLGIAQRVHEYCESLAYEIEDNRWEYGSDLLEKADFSWVQEGFRQSYQVVEGHLNVRVNTMNWKDKIIYCISRVTTRKFSIIDLEGVVRREFPKSTEDCMPSNFGAILNELAVGDTPLLVKNKKTKDYYIKDPRYLMGIRIMLQKYHDTERVEKRQFTI